MAAASPSGSSSQSSRTLTAETTVDRSSKGEKMRRQEFLGGATLPPTEADAGIPRPGKVLTVTFALAGRNGLGAVRTFARRQGLTVMAEQPQRRTAVVRGSVAQLEKAFGTQFVRRRLPSGRHIRVVLRTATLPAELTRHVVYVHGLVGFPDPAHADAGQPTARARQWILGGRPHRDRSLRRVGWSPPGKIVDVTLFMRRSNGVRAIEPFARRHGLAVLDDDLEARTVVLRGTLRQLGAAFGVRFVRLARGEYQVRGVTRPGTLPTHLAREVAFVLGLKTYPIRRQNADDDASKHAEGDVDRDHGTAGAAREPARPGRNRGGHGEGHRPGPAAGDKAPRHVGSERAWLGARLVRGPPADEHVTVSMVLRRRSSESPLAATRALAPHAERSYLTRAEFAGVFGADPAHVAAVQDFARVSELRVRKADCARRTVVVSGPSTAMARAFGTPLAYYELDGRVYRGIADDAPVTLPPGLANVVVAVLGLDTFPVAERRPRSAGSLTPANLAALRQFPGRGAPAQSIGIIELGGGFGGAAELTAFSTHLGLPVPTVVPVSLDGETCRSAGQPYSADREVCLDIAVSAAVAPSATIVVYFAPNTDRGLVDAVMTAVHDMTNRPSVISISWGNSGTGFADPTRNALNAAFQDAASIGVTITSAPRQGGSGDGTDNDASHIDFPASSPYVLACGDDTVGFTDQAIASDIAWAGNGDKTPKPPSPGRPRHASAPAPALIYSDARRVTPGISVDAEPGDGFAVRVDDQSLELGRTNAAAALWASVLACTNCQLPQPASSIRSAFRVPAAERSHHSGSGVSGHQRVAAVARVKWLGTYLRETEMAR